MIYDFILLVLIKEVLINIEVDVLFNCRSICLHVNINFVFYEALQNKNDFKVVCEITFIATHTLGPWNQGTYQM